MEVQGYHANFENWKKFLSSMTPILQNDTDSHNDLLWTAAQTMQLGIFSSPLDHSQPQYFVFSDGVICIITGLTVAVGHSFPENT